jgi:SulP family sulfate permease
MHRVRFARIGSPLTRHAGPAPRTAAKPRQARLAAWGARTSSLAGLALAQAPESLAYGLLVLAPLGPGHAPQAMGLALLCAVLANAVAGLAGGGRLITAPRAALALLSGALVETLVSYRGPEGPLATPHVLGLLAAGLVAGGALQMLLGWLRIGDIVKYTPHPVRLGLASGVGLLLVGSAWPAVVGAGFGGGWPLDPAAWRPGAWAVAAVTLLAAWAAARLGLGRRRLASLGQAAPLLCGLAAGTALQALLQVFSTTLPAWSAPGATAGVPQLPLPWFTSPAAWPAGDWLPPVLLAPLALFAATLAALGALDTLLGCSLVDGQSDPTQPRQDANRVLRAQGLATLLAGAVCSMPASPSAQRSLALLRATPGQRHATLGYAVALALWMLLAPGWLGVLPLSAIGALLLQQGLQSVDPWLLRLPFSLLRGQGRAGAGSLTPEQRRVLRDNWAVAAGVTSTSLVLGLAAAVAVGAAFAVLLFVRANMRPVVRSQHSGLQRRSLKVRSPQLEAVLQQHAQRIQVLELQGALFFGTADALRDSLAQQPPDIHTVVLDLYGVSEIDATGARILLETASGWARQGRHLLAAEWPAGDPRRHVVDAIAQASGLPALAWAPDTDTALEQAEEHLLAGLPLPTLPAARVALGDTLLAHGLDAEELALLAAAMQPVAYAHGEAIFRAGETADALLVSLQGNIGVFLPGGGRRLVCFGPGTLLGEMAVLARGTRSADAVAESPVQALRLTVLALETLQNEQPVLAAKLHANIARHLSARLRALTQDLQTWMARGAATADPPAEPRADILYG